MEGTAAVRLAVVVLMVLDMAGFSWERHQLYRYGISDINRGVARKLYTDCSYFGGARRRKGMRGKE